MPTTLKTGDFSLRALPVTPRIDPANFDAQLGQLLNLYTEAMQVPAKLEQVRATQRAGEIGRAMQPQNLELAKVQAAQNIELLPYETATKKRAAAKALEEPIQTDLGYDEAGNLVRVRIVRQTDPITGEITEFNQPEIVKTAREVADERANATSLAELRKANSEAALSNAQSRKMDAETKARLADIKSKFGGSDANMSVRVFEPKNQGRSIGYTVVRFNKTTGKTMLQRFGLDLQKVGEPVELPGMPDLEGLGDEVDLDEAGGSQPFKIDMPAEQAAPTAPTGGTVQPFLGGSAAQLPTPPTRVAPVAPAAPLPTLSPQQALLTSFPAGRFMGTNGLTYEKTAEGKIVRVQ